MKQHILILIFSISLSSCSAQNNNLRLCQIEEIKEIDYKNGSDNILVDRNSITKENSRIVLPIDSSKNLILKDTLVEEESPDMEQYDYLGYAPSNNNYVVKVTYLLEDEIWFIDKSNGTINKGLSYFSISQQGTIATYNMPESDRYDGIQIFKLINGNRKELCSVKDRDWFPENIVWKNENEIFMKALFEGKTKYLKLKIK